MFRGKVNMYFRGCEKFAIAEDYQKPVDEESCGHIMKFKITHKGMRNH